MSFAAVLNTSSEASVASVARIEQSEIRDCAAKPAPDFVSLNPGYACFIVRSTMSNSDAPSRQHRKPGHDDAELHCRDATSIRVFFHASIKLASNGREAMSLLPKEGGGAPNGAPRLPRLDAQARPRPNK
jgi:hypothetical protein